jgi:hypothetical protein
MHLNLKITSAEAYFGQQGTDIAKVPEDQVEALKKVLAAELSWYALMHISGLCQSIADIAEGTFKALREEYELMWEPYQSYLGY